MPPDAGGHGDCADDDVGEEENPFVDFSAARDVSPPLLLVPDTHPPQREVYPEMFERFWAAYPRKDEKRAAYRKWQATVAKNRRLYPKLLIIAAERYALECAALGTLRHYIKLGETFLGPMAPWEDFLLVMDDEPDTPIITPAAPPRRREPVLYDWSQVAMPDDMIEEAIHATV